MLKKVIEAEIKALEEGNFEVIASSGKPDRLGDTIDPKGWYLTNYKKNPVILWSHSSGGFGTPAIPPVAKADKVWVENEKELKVKGHFADTPFAQELRSLVEGGFLNAVSVGFIPLVEDAKGEIEMEEKMYRQAFDEEVEKGTYGEGEHFTKQELLELSWVAVPALATALVSARKEMKLPLLTKALEEMEEKPKDAEEGIEIKPYPNEHSCRLEPPGKYKRFRRKNCEVKHDGKCIDVIYGITKGEDEKTERQALRYDKKIWTEASAKSHCADNDGTFEPAGESKEEKEGRVISEKNRKLVNNCVVAMEEAISSLKELIQATEPPEKGTTPLELKGRKTFVNQKSKKSEQERLLIMFDKMIETLLRKLRQKS